MLIGISIEFLFLLLNTSVVDLFKILLLSELVISRSSFLSNDAGFIKLFL